VTKGPGAKALAACFPDYLHPFAIYDNLLTAALSLLRGMVWCGNQGGYVKSARTRPAGVRLRQVAKRRSRPVKKFSRLALKPP